MRRYFLILLLVVAALGGIAVLALFRQPTLGLDLQGGLGIVLQAEAPKGQQVNDEGMERSIEIIRNRIDRLGVAEPEIRQQGPDQILVELPGVRDARRAAELVGTTARLEFYDLEDDVTGPSEGPPQQPVVENTEVLPLLTAAGRVDRGSDASTWIKLKQGEEPTAWYLFSKDKKERLAGPADTSEELLEDLDGEPPNGARFYVVPEGRIVLTCSAATARVCPGGDVLQTGGSFEPAPNTTYYYLFEYRPDDRNSPIPELTGDDLRLRGTQQDFDGSQPIVTLEFNGEGGDKFHDITRELANRGRQAATLLGVPTDDRDARQPALQSFAIVLDGEIRSFPTIDFVGDTAQGIAGGRAQITGLDDVQEAKDLALVLQTGALPYSFERQALTEISATLGEDSLDQAKLAAAAGLALVLLFLLVVYRFLGVVALIGLAIYGVFLYGTILAFGVTLTLPGIAGLVLTIGVAADANIVIFERIKEEVRAGKSVRAAIANGYRKGFNTIVDGNVVTMITAAVLFLIATGGVRGFALMLLIGTLMSMVTAVLATRALLGVLSGFRWFDNPAFMGASAERIPDWQKADFVGRRRIWFALSAIVILIGVVSLGVRSLNLGIDFEGGSQATFQTREPVSIERVRAEAAAVGEESAVIQGRGEETRGGYTSFSLKTESPIEEGGRLLDSLESDLGATNVGVTTVSASFSEQILRGALIAIVVSLALIVLYVSLRYQFAYSLPVLVALFHDVLVAIGVYSLSGREVTAASVAALLTILGYSIYDTIIIFDRVRENVGLMRRSSFAAIANQSLWETIRRSLATTFIALLPVASLFVFGGETLKDFAFAILVGVGSGAYSTIFIATPLLTILKERDPEYAKRKDAGLVEKLEPALETDGRPAPAPQAAEAPVAATEEPAPVGDGAAAAAAARREARRKRRRARPHGRAR
ncbi:MAG TPA: protein translocase subunit SecD [Gaiellaceae bacterium]|nr:protein translocase subunit SecD [Gaiellaceae bacterium]